MIASPEISDVKPILVAGREVRFFELASAASLRQCLLSRICVRESDVLVDSSQSAITSFLQRSHSWQNVPQFVWIDERAIKPVPLVEAEAFWVNQAHRGDRWAAMVVRELDRLEDQLYTVFSGLEIPEQEKWTLTYRSSDGGLTTLANDTDSFAPNIYRPTLMESRAAAYQRSRAVA